MELIKVPVSPGELIDKVSILEIKLEEFTDPHKIENVERELGLLRQVLQETMPDSIALRDLHHELKKINKMIWDTENDVREFWNDDQKFLEAARGSHYQNDERARVKKEINTLLGSHIMEEKSHPKYEHKV